MSANTQQPRPLRDPDIAGHAPAWRIDMSGLEPRPDDAPVGDSYLLHSPDSHAFWDWHFVSMVHLRDLPGQTRAPHRRFPAATHEIPLVDAQRMFVGGHFELDRPVRWLQEHAFRLAGPVIGVGQRLVGIQLLWSATAGASIDSDLARFWRSLIEQAAAHERGGEPAPGGDPATREEHDRLVIANATITGYGLEVTQHMPCPFCAAPDWQVFPVIAVAERMAQPATCANCGRTAKTLITAVEGGASFEIVQTGGPDPPDYLPPMRRMDEQ